MIEGFKVDVTADELVRHLDARIRHHHDRAVECEGRARRVDTPTLEFDDDEESCWHERSRAYGLDRSASRHRHRELFLIFVRDHVVANEIYRLTEGDLRLLEWLPADEGLLSL